MIKCPPSEEYFANCKVYAPLPKDQISGPRLQRSFMPPFHDHRSKSPPKTWSTMLHDLCKKITTMVNY